VSASPVAWTEKKTETELNRTGCNRTGCNRTVGCGCLLWKPRWVAGCLNSEIFKNWYKTGCNRLQPVLYSIIYGMGLVIMESVVTILQYGSQRSAWMNHERAQYNNKQTNLADSDIHQEQDHITHLTRHASRESNKRKSQTSQCSHKGTAKKSRSQTS
jgi:hypothetical protein